MNTAAWSQIVGFKKKKACLVLFSLFLSNQMGEGENCCCHESCCLILFSFFLPTSFFRERVQEDVKEHVKPFVNYCCFKDEGRHLLGPWILGKINPTNCCVKYSPGTSIALSVANQENILCNFLLFIFRFSATKWTSQEGRLQCMNEPAAKYEGELTMSSKAT